mmetsp:Transcript_2692/g.5335  ORF Transcript_2692/g.5335 Transcript_2692/m.5335 type:complete len:230 (-) Transcript_2692:363-1052(-)
MPSTSRGALTTLTHTRFPCTSTTLTRISFSPGPPRSLTSILPRCRADEAAPPPTLPSPRRVQPLRGPCHWDSRLSLVVLSATSMLLTSLSNRASVLLWHRVREREGSQRGKMDEGFFEGKVKLKQNGEMSKAVATGTIQASAETVRLRNEALWFASQTATLDERQSRTASEYFSRCFGALNIASASGESRAFTTRRIKARAVKLNDETPIQRSDPELFLLLRACCERLP